MVKNRNSVQDRKVCAGTQAEAQAHRAPAAPAPGSDTSKGAPPSNTAPANCIDDQNMIIRAGVDSLYLSFVGDLSQAIEHQLIELKSLAKSDDPLVIASAVLELSDHRFEVLAGGTRNFPYTLKDGVFNIQLSKASSEKLPMAYVQISSEALTLSGLIPVVRELISILRLLGLFTEIKVSRVDICCDFSTSVNFADLSLDAWISRSSKLHDYFNDRVFGGYVFGKGSPMLARLYDKTLEIKKSKKDYMKDIWWGEGWDRKSQVWRLEFQIKRSVLVELGISSFDNLLATLNSMWRYATQNWLRLVLPGEDKTRSRWPDHPLWIELQKVKLGDGDQELLKRCRLNRIPSDRYLFINGLSAITSYMAIENIPTFKEAAPQYLDDAAGFHIDNSVFTGEDIEAFCRRHAALKARKYNTKFGKEKVDSAGDYRKAKGRI